MSLQPLRVSSEKAVERALVCGATPLAPFPGTQRKWHLRLACGHENWVRLSSLEAIYRESRTGCPVCGQKEREKKHTLSLDVLRPFLLTQGAELLEDEWRGMDKSYLIRHSCGWEGRRFLYDVLRHNGTCPGCANYGYKEDVDGFLYLIHHPLGAWKIGITNDPSNRLKTHFQRGYDPGGTGVWGPVDAKVAKQIEDRVLASWRQEGWAEALPANIEGFKETIADSFSRREIVSQIQALLPVVFSLDDLQVMPVTRKEAAVFVGLWHYTRSLPVGVRCVGLRKPTGELCGVAAFGRPNYKETGKAIFGDIPFTELRRFALEGGLPSNTGSWFLSRAIKLLDPGIKAVLAFSDPGAGHDGTLYKACNFREAGLSSAVSGYHYINQEGVFIHKRVVWDQAKANHLKESEYAQNTGLLRVEDGSKRRFVFYRS